MPVWRNQVESKSPCTFTLIKSRRSRDQEEDIAVFICTDLISMEMFENLHLQKHRVPLPCKRYREMVFNVCGSLDVVREVSKNGHAMRLSHLTETSCHLDSYATLVGFNFRLKQKE